MRIQILLLSILAPWSAGAAKTADPAALCRRDNPTNTELKSILAELGEHPFYKFARKHSAPKSCKIVEERITLIFSNGDQLVFETKEPNPSAEALPATPADEKLAFETAKSALRKMETCAPYFVQPTEVSVDQKSKQTTKTYTCGDLGGIRLVLNGRGRTVQFRTWFVR